MPGGADDKYLGSKPHSSHKAYAEMVKAYGLAEGTRVYHALLADRKARGKTYRPHKRA